MTRIKQTITRTVIIWPSRIEITALLIVGLRVRLFKKDTSPSNVGGIDPEAVVLADSGDAPNRSDLLDKPQLPKKTRTRKSLIFWSDRPSNNALAAEAEVVVGANNGLEGHVSISRADEEI
jgi:hypothetical protein